MTSTPLKPGHRGAASRTTTPKAPVVEGPALEQRPWSGALLRAFVLGDATLADLEGVTPAVLQELAQIAYLYIVQGRLDLAEKIFGGLHILDPLNSYFATALGAIAQRSGKLEEADAHYSAAIAVNPFDATAHGNRGDVRLQLQRFSEGLADLERAVELDPQKLEPGAGRIRTLLDAFRELRPKPTRPK